MKSFLQIVNDTYRTLTGRPPSLFEQSTADIMGEAYTSVSERIGRPFFETISSATGGGKTKAAEALIKHVMPRPVTFVIKEIVEIDDVYRDLVRILPEGVRVAMMNSVHGPNSKRGLTAEKERMMGRPVAATFKLEEIKSAHVVLTTHEAWRNAVAGKNSREFLLRRFNQEALVIVDEDPDLEQTFVCQPQDVSDLIEVLSDVVDPDEARSFGFLPTHRLVPVLRSVYDRMERIKIAASKNAPLSRDRSMITDDDVTIIEQEINDDDLTNRAMKLGGTNWVPRVQRARATVEFLRAAGEGRVFYAQDRHPAFHAYSYAVPAQHNTIILDGTADLNGMFAASDHIRVIDDELQPNYSRMAISYVIPPKEFRGKMKPGGLYKNRWSAEPLMKWFMEELLIPNTESGDRVLVYAKQDLLSFDLQRDFDESESRQPYYIEKDGRCIWFCHFGSGRGSNKWKHCNVCFRLSEFYPKKAAAISKAASLMNVELSDADLRQMGSGTTKHRLYEVARDTHVMVHNKQETARICIRKLDNDGVCDPARVYFVDSDLELLQEYQARAYPGSNRIEVLDLGGHKAATQTQTVIDHMLTLHGPVDITARELAESCGVPVDSVKKALQRHWPVLNGQGWKKSTEKEVRGTGRAACYVLS
ncbi:MAG: hypothetical protein AAGI27_03560 [Pseudomonadota bacterium]